MRVKEVKVSDTERFVICHNPDAAERDAHIREQLLAQLEELIAGSDTLPVMKRGELRRNISTNHVRRDLDRLHAVTFTGPTGTFRQRTDPTEPQIDLYARLDLPLPKKIIEITPRTALTRRNAAA